MSGSTNLRFMRRKSFELIEPTTSLESFSCSSSSMSYDDHKDSSSIMVSSPISVPQYLLYAAKDFHEASNYWKTCNFTQARLKLRNAIKRLAQMDSTCSSRSSVKSDSNINSPTMKRAKALSLNDLSEAKKFAESVNPKVFSKEDVDDLSEKIESFCFEDSNFFGNESDYPTNSLTYPISNLTQDEIVPISYEQQQNTKRVFSTQEILDYVERMCDDCPIEYQVFINEPLEEVDENLELVLEDKKICNSGCSQTIVKTTSFVSSRSSSKVSSRSSSKVSSRSSSKVSSRSSSKVSSKSSISKSSSKSSIKSKSSKDSLENNEEDRHNPHEKIQNYRNNKHKGFKHSSRKSFSCDKKDNLKSIESFFKKVNKNFKAKDKKKLNPLENPNKNVMNHNNSNDLMEIDTSMLSPLDTSRSDSQFNSCIYALLSDSLSSLVRIEEVLGNNFEAKLLKDSSVKLQKALHGSTSIHYDNSLLNLHTYFDMHKCYNNNQPLCSMKEEPNNDLSYGIVVDIDSESNSKMDTDIDESSALLTDDEGIRVPEENYVYYSSYIDSDVSDEDIRSGITF